MNRLQSLDFLRAVAILLVLLMHVESNPVFIQMGWIGVDLFFVLSGFLVTGMLMKEYLVNGFMRVRYFLIRRGFKIYPMFYILLCFHLFYYYFKGNPPAVSQILAEVFFLQNYFHGIMGVSWSLAVEEHFYYLTAVFILIARFWNFFYTRKAIPFVAGFVLILCLFLRVLVWQQGGYNGMYVNYTPTHLRLDSISMGVLIAYFYSFYQKEFLAFHKMYFFWLLLLSVCMILPVFYFARNSMFVNTIGYTLLASGFGVIVAISVCYAGWVQRLKRNRGLNWLLQILLKIGTCSYAIYLSHFLFGAIVVNKIRMNEVVGFSHFPLVIIYLAFCIILGILLTNFIEKPFLSIRDRYFPSPY